MAHATINFTDHNSIDAVDDAIEMRCWRLAVGDLALRHRFPLARNVGAVGPRALPLPFVQATKDVATRGQRRRLSVQHEELGKEAVIVPLPHLKV